MNAKGGPRGCGLRFSPRDLGGAGVARLEAQVPRFSVGGGLTVPAGGYGSADGAGWHLLDNRLSWLVGRDDLTTEFYRVQSAGMFINSSFGIGPEFAHSGVAGPSLFPTTALGTRVDFKPSANYVIHPRGTRATRDALVPAVRIALSL